MIKHIKVVKASSDNYWYSDFIGYEFFIDHFTVYENLYTLYNPNTSLNNSSDLYFHKDDIEIIKDDCDFNVKSLDSKFKHQHIKEYLLSVDSLEESILNLNTYNVVKAVLDKKELLDV